MREQIQLMQSGGNSQMGGSNQTSQPRETFSDALSVPVEVKRVRKQKDLSADCTASEEARRYSAKEIVSVAGRCLRIENFLTCSVPHPLYNEAN